MPSFDVVSEVDLHEVTNAIDQAQREISTRYDFKSSTAEIEYANENITLTTDSDFQINQMRSIVYNKLTKRNVNIASFDSGKIEASGMKVRQNISIRQGIDKDTAKKIVKKIKESKQKVQAAIQGEQVRVTGKKRDDLQSIISLLKESKFEVPLQFTNFRD